MTVRRSGVPRRARLLVVVAVTAVVVLTAASAAMADSAQLTITDTGGHSDPVAGVPRVFTVSGTAAVSEYLFMKQRPAGGAPCGPSANTDPGSTLTGFYDDFWSKPVTGAFSLPVARTWNTPGTFLFCIWLASSNTAVSTPISQVITFRSPTGTISATVNPVIPRPGQDAQVTVTGASEAPEYVYAKVRAAGGAPCAPTFQSDSGDSVINSAAVNGAFSQQATVNEDTPGSYVLCLWLASSSEDTAPIAGPQAVPFSVVQPPAKVKAASVLNCTTQRHVGSVRARFVSAVCVRYRFSVTPLPGQKLSVSFITPARRTYKRVSSPWPDQTSPSIIIGSLPSGGYKHRRGVWQAVLRINGKEINRVAFRVR